MNHLMIGLGGTGGRVLRSLRKLSYQQFRGSEPDDVALEYLFVDSDPKSFSDSDPSWSVLGKSVHLAKRNQLLIAEANLGAVVNAGQEPLLLAGEVAVLMRGGSG